MVSGKGVALAEKESRPLEGNPRQGQPQMDGEAETVIKMKTNTLYEWNQPCPRCGKFFYANWNDAKVCPTCGALIADHEWAGMVRLGKWVEVEKSKPGAGITSFRFPNLALIASLLLIGQQIACGASQAPSCINWRLVNNGISSDLIILALTCLIFAKAREIWRRK